jgi:hypothetical protein
LKPGPKYSSIFLHLAGDSTITRVYLSFVSLFSFFSLFGIVGIVDMSFFFDTIGGIGYGYGYGYGYQQ